MVDTLDLGEAIARVVTNPRLRGGTYELCSPDTVSVVEMAEILGAAMGKPLLARRQNPEEWASAMQAGGAPTWSVETVMGMCHYHDNYGYDGGNSFALEALLGRPARSYKAFAARVAEQQLDAVPA